MKRSTATALLLATTLVVAAPAQTRERHDERSFDTLLHQIAADRLRLDFREVVEPAWFAPEHPSWYPHGLDRIGHADIDLGRFFAWERTWQHHGWRGLAPYCVPAVPEPPALALLLAGLLGMWAWKRRRDSGG